MLSDDLIDDLASRLQVAVTLESRAGQRLTAFGIRAESSWAADGLSDVDRDQLNAVAGELDEDGWHEATVLRGSGYVLDLDDDAFDSADEIHGDLVTVAETLSDDEDRVGVLLAFEMPTPFDHPALAQAVFEQAARAVDGRVERFVCVTGRHLRSVDPNSDDAAAEPEFGQGWWNEVGWSALSPELVVLALPRHLDDLDD